MHKAHWYIIHIFSGFEEKVAAEIIDSAKRQNLDQYVEEIYVPKERVIQISKGKRVASEKKSFPGYVLIKAALNDYVFSLIKNTNRVTNFLCSDGKPVVIKDAEVERIKGRVMEHMQETIVDAFHEGDEIKVCDGAFAGFNGKVKASEDDGKKIKVEVTIFGRPVMVDLTSEQIEKV